MCNNENGKFNKGDEDMSITKPRPMEHEFKTKEEERAFAKWVNGENPTSKRITDQLKRDLIHYRTMKKRYNERNN